MISLSAEGGSRPQLRVRTAPRLRLCLRKPTTNVRLSSSYYIPDHARPVEIRPADRAENWPCPWRVVRYQLCPVDVLTVDRHASPRARSGDEARVDARPVEVRASDALVARSPVCPIDVIAVDRQPRKGGALDSDERLLDAAAVEVGSSNRYVAADEVDMLVVER